MRLPPHEILKQLGAGELIAGVCQAAGLARDQFETWWQEEIRSRVPDIGGVHRAAVRRPVQLDRDHWGIPPISAANDDDRFFGFGYALAHDRLFQLDYLRRRGSGRLAEILGPGGTELELLTRVAGICSVLQLDLLARTVGIRRIAEREW